MATADLLGAPDEVNAYRARMVCDVQARLDLLAEGIECLRREGMPVQSTTPQGAIYLSAQFALRGKRTPTGETLDNDDAVRRYLLQFAGMAVVPFQAFGRRDDTGWFRLSVGAVSLGAIRELIPRLKIALQALQ